MRVSAAAQQEKPDENTLARIRVHYAVSGLGEIKPSQTAPEEDPKSKDASAAPHRP